MTKTNPEANPSPKPASSGWIAKVLILAGGPAIALSIAGIASVLPQIEAALARTETDQMLVKMLVGLGGAAMVLGAPLTGFLADRVGLRWVLFVNYVLFAIAGSAGLYLNDLYSLVAARFILGLAAAGAVTASIIIINRTLSPAERPTWFGAYIALGAVAPIFLQPATGMLAEINWHWAFAVYLLAAPLAVLAFFFRDEASQDAAPVAQAACAKPEPLWKWFPYRFALLGFVMGCIVYLPIIYAPFLLRELGITSPTQIAFVLMADAATCATLAFLFGKACRFLSERSILMLAFAATAIGGAVTGLATNYLTVLIGMAIAGLGVGWFMPSLMTIVGKRVLPIQQGRAAGLIKAANYLATPLCVLAAEPLSRAYGPRAGVLLSVALACGLLILAILQLLQRRARGKGESLLVPRKAEA